MKAKQFAPCLLAPLLALWPARAQLIIAVDMDTSTPAIESTRTAKAGDIITVGIVFDLSSHAGGIAIYGVSARFDNAELQLSGTPAAVELAPPGFFNNTPGVKHEKQSIGGGLGEVWNFEGESIAGVFSGSFMVGTITFEVPAAPLDDGRPDIWPGIFDGMLLDGLFDATATLDEITNVRWEPGYLVPEPGGWAAAALPALAGVLGAGWLRRRRQATA
jgi:hypothetical protein